MKSKIILILLFLIMLFNAYSQGKKNPLTKIYLNGSTVSSEYGSKLQSYEAYIHELGDSSISVTAKTTHDMKIDALKKPMIIPVEKINKIEYSTQASISELSSGILLGGVIGAGSGLIIGTISGYREGADPGKAEIHVFTEGENYIPRSRGFKMVTRGLGYGLVGSIFGGLSGLIIKSLTNKNTIMIDGNQFKYDENKLELSKRVVVF
jgi:hypothetical protein